MQEWPKIGDKLKFTGLKQAFHTNVIKNGGYGPMQPTSEVLRAWVCAGLWHHRSWLAYFGWLTLQERGLVFSPGPIKIAVYGNFCQKACALAAGRNGKR